MHAPSLHQAGHTQHARRAAARRQASPHPAPRTLHLYQGACRASAQDSTSGGDPAGASSDSYFMQLALEQAKTAASLEEVPIGAVVVDADGRTVLAACHNRTHTDKDPTAHAELQAIQQAARKLGNWRLQGTTLYSTLEPCPMCAGAILQARVGRLVYGARQPRLGADGSWVSLFPPAPDRKPGETKKQRARRLAQAQEDGSSRGLALQPACEGRTQQTESDLTNHSNAFPSCTNANTPIHPFHNQMTVTRGILETDCATVMEDFFRRRREPSPDRR